MLYVNSLNLVQTVAATVEPLVLPEVKDNLGVDTADDDSLIESLIEAAREHVESYTGRALVERTYRADVRNWSANVILPRPPMISVSSITYYDTANAQQTWATANYEVDAQGGRILLAATKSIPSYYSRYNAWSVTYIAGYASTTSPVDYRAPVPAAIKAAMQLIIGDLYQNRESKIVSRLVNENKTLQRILDPYRVR